MSTATEQAVANGAALLDVRRPDWAERFDADALDDRLEGELFVQIFTAPGATPRDCCIEACRVLFGRVHAPDWIKFGFDLDRRSYEPGVGFDFSNQFAARRALYALWAAEAEKRLRVAA